MAANPVKTNASLLFTLAKFQESWPAPSQKLCAHCMNMSSGELDYVYNKTGLGPFHIHNNSFCFRNTWPNTPETSPTNAKFAPNSLITRQTWGATCACTQAKNPLLVKSAAKASSAKIAWSSTLILTRRSNPSSWHDNKCLINPHPLGEERLCSSHGAPTSISC